MKPIKRAIALCWIMLVACFAIKLFGGNWFEVVCTNEHFSNLCNFVQNNQVAFFSLSFVTYIFPSSVIILSAAGIPHPTKKQLLVCLSLVLFSWLFVFLSLNVKSIVELFVFLVLPTVLSIVGKKDKDIKPVIKSTWWRGSLGYVIVFVFQLISIITRNAMPSIMENNVLVISIMLIDYYIMAVLFYLYVKLKKGE